MLAGAHAGCLAPVLACVLLLLAAAALPAAPAFSVTPNANPRARVVTIRNPEASEAFEPRPEVVRVMVERALTNLTAKPTACSHAARQ